jgi:hypothetical protein
LLIVGLDFDIPRYARYWNIDKAMSGSKAALKSIVAAVRAQKYDDVIQEARTLISRDPKSFQA